VHETRFDDFECDKEDLRVNEDDLEWEDDDLRVNGDGVKV
jgi:hypothetical protein